ncbi:MULTISPECIES: ABC transporter permease [unclassified Aminobacter]|jgi:ABC-type spermidine/putrescine transport system, permease component II|uniref:ABC transporter permease n=1 Tax=unclassified Aminobacter TaxID=2644704 RepID=UPI000466F434|nr:MULTISPECIES: ABC transporter permease [unclassified Aminobacter]TWH28164.1 putative spermidine/putrescine transport system permease protein [Aminobacter sp. J15]
MMLRAYVILFVCFLLAPIVAISAGSFTETSYVVFPPQGFTLKWYFAALGQRPLIEALGFSLAIGAISASVATLIALPLGLAITRYRSRLNIALYMLAMTPAMLPAVFLGLAFLIGYSWVGMGGSSWPLVAGHVVMTVPFALSLILVGLQSVDGTLELAARSLGASALKTFLVVTLPLISWSLAAGWGFAFLISFGALEVSLFLSTSTTVTLPVQIYTTLDWSPLDPTLTAISSGVVIITLAVLVITARTVRMDRFLKRGQR